VSSRAESRDEESETNCNRRIVILPFDYTQGRLAQQDDSSIGNDVENQ